MLSGVNIDATVALARALTIPVIASGGVTNLDDIVGSAKWKQKASWVPLPVVPSMKARWTSLRRKSCPTNWSPDVGLAKRLIPCLDVTAGRVVKGVNFVGLRDAGDPVEIARRYDEQGADELTFLDITATSDDRDLILHIIEDVAESGVHSADRGRRRAQRG